MERYGVQEIGANKRFSSFFSQKYSATDYSMSVAEYFLFDERLEMT